MKESSQSWVWLEVHGESWCLLGERGTGWGSGQLVSGAFEEGKFHFLLLTFVPLERMGGLGCIILPRSTWKQKVTQSWHWPIMQAHGG